MDKIRQNVKFDGDLDAFFEFMRSDDQFYYANTDKDREKYMAQATEIINKMKSRLDELQTSSE